MSDVLSAALGVLLATNQPAALSNFVERATGFRVEVAAPDGPLQAELHRIMEEDERALLDVQRWLMEERAEIYATGRSPTLKAKIEQRYKTVRDLYEDILQRHPKFTEARMAYASFLGEIYDEYNSMQQYERVIEEDSDNAAAMNNLANHYGHNGPVEKAFDLYERAIRLRPEEPIYYHNHGTTVYLFRRHAMAHYGITEQEVFDKALRLYSRALELNPGDFAMATDVAKSFYGIQPRRVDEAMAAWNVAYRLAFEEREKQGVRIHFARWENFAGRYDKAREWINSVTLEEFLPTKTNVLVTIAQHEAKAKGLPPPHDPREK
jgi:tetratricopeptide (TPR) repeat protein